MLRVGSARRASVRPWEGLSGVTSTNSRLVEQTCDVPHLCELEKELVIRPQVDGCNGRTVRTRKGDDTDAEYSQLCSKSRTLIPTPDRDESDACWGASSKSASPAIASRAEVGIESGPPSVMVKLYDTR